MGLGYLLSEGVGGATNNIFCFSQEQVSLASFPHLQLPSQVNEFPLASSTRQWKPQEFPSRFVQHPNITGPGTEPELGLRVFMPPSSGVGECLNSPIPPVDSWTISPVVPSIYSQLRLTTGCGDRGTSLCPEDPQPCAVSPPPPLKPPV